MSAYAPVVATAERVSGRLSRQCNGPLLAVSDLLTMVAFRPDRSLTFPDCGHSRPADPVVKNAHATSEMHRHLRAHNTFSCEIEKK